MSLSKFQRAMSWNVDFFNFSLRVGGVYQYAGMLSVADIAHELGVCFVCDPPDDNAASWAPALLLQTPPAQNLIILDQQNDNPFPTPTTGIDSYEYVFHFDCHRLGESHKMDDTCIYRQPGMVERRNDQRYTDISSKSTDTRLEGFPTRSSSQSRSVSQSRTSSLKRDSTHSSRSPSPSRTVTTIPVELSFIERREMNRIMSQYATNVLQSCPSCVITGEGNYFGLQGPGLEAAHIVPQSQWNMYPIDGGMPDPSDLWQLKRAWRTTWDARRNGIMLLSTLHKCFDARLIAFHPKTHLIRVFVDYSSIKKYHGQKVILPKLIPEEVWQYHWDMCCLENTVGEELPLLSRLTDIPELPGPKARKLAHGGPTKQGSSPRFTATQTTDTPSTDAPATDTHAINTQAFSASMYHGAHPPSPPLGERAPEERTPWPSGKQTLNEPDTVQQVIGEDNVLDEINAEYGRGRSRKRARPGCTATEEHAGGRDGAQGAKKQRLESSPQRPFPNIGQFAIL